MNIARNIGLSLLLVSLAAPAALAALSGDGSGNATGIEVNSDDAPAQRRIDRMLAVKVLDELTLQRHSRSSLLASAPMEGHYVTNGAEAPEQFGQRDLSVYMSNPAPPAVVGDSAGLAQMTAVHVVGSGAVSGGAPVASAGVVSAATQYVVTNTPVKQPSVPLPPALMLMASGLFCLPPVRRRFTRTW